MRNLAAPLALAALLFAAPALAAGPKAVVPETVIDVGKVDRGDQVTHAFEIRNEGDATLQITEVKPSCGCTVAKYDRVIRPGGVGTVRAVLDTAEFRGPVAKSISVYTNDSALPRVNLVIKADIRPQVEVRPGYARFIVVQGETYEPSEQLLWSDEAPNLQIQEVKSPYPFLRAAWEKVETEAGEPNRWRVILTLDAKAPVGPMADFIEVRTNHPRQKLVKISVSGYVRPVLAVTPRVADFGRRELSEPYEAKLEVKNLGSESVRLRDVESDLEGLSAAIETLEEGKLYSLNLTLSPGMEKGRFRGKVTVSTTSARQPVLEVDVTGTIL